MKSLIAAVLVLPLMSWSIWSYFSQTVSVEEEISATSVQLPNVKVKIFQHIQHVEGKLERLEEKYMIRLEFLARLLKSHKLENLSIGDEMPANLPSDVENAWKSYLGALTQLEKIKNAQHEIEESFIKMAHQGIYLALTDR